MIRAIKDFFQLEAASGVVLLIATAFALLIANSPLNDSYTYILKDLHVAHWINDGLMAIFFLVVGLEIKREMGTGQLSNFKSAMVPFVAALAGIIVPASIYYLVNMDIPENLRGMAIPTATDIAFSLGVLALLGSRAPLSLKILLTAIAIIDDLVGILIIAIFYTNDLNFFAIGGGLLVVAALLILNFSKVQKLPPYLFLGLCLWLLLLPSGVHPTMAGVITAFCIPLSDKSDRLMHALHPYSAYLIVPVFALANAGLSLSNITVEDIADPLTVGIIAGMVLGKVIGITTAVTIFKPKDLSFSYIVALGFLCGIGFTMSLFMGELAFAGEGRETQIRLGVLIASAVSAAFSFVFLTIGRSSLSRR